eukprot:12454052-Alexandrium_andersonii.AAC.1
MVADPTTAQDAMPLSELLLESRRELGQPSMGSLQHCLRVNDRPPSPQVLQSELQVDGGPHDLTGDHRT